jgi:hypothetical protein
MNERFERDMTGELTEHGRAELRSWAINVGHLTETEIRDYS